MRRGPVHGGTTGNLPRVPGEATIGGMSSDADGATEPRSEPVRIADLAALEEPLVEKDASFDARYEDVRVLGRGGMGDVLLAHDHRIGRHVAIKVSRVPEGDDGEALRRFVREARVQGQLDHPAVVPVYDLGTRADGAVFFTMKRIRGVTLDAALAGLRRGDADAEQRWTRRRLLTAFLMVCQVRISNSTAPSA
jgi:eukaryotic-like serine/threonine-protein kinase